MLPCTYTLQISYFQDILKLKPNEQQTPSPHKNYYRTHCYKICKSCFLEFLNVLILCKKCLVPRKFEVEKLCRREMNLCICGVVSIMNLEEFHTVVIKSSEYIMTKKRLNNIVVIFVLFQKSY